MLKRHYITPAGSYAVGGNNRVIYTPVVVVEDVTHAHIYVAGRGPRGLDGTVMFKGDMRGQIGQDLDTSESVGIGDVQAQTEQAMANIRMLIEEAGGRFTCFDGTSSIETGNAVGSNGHVHPHVLLLLNPERPLPDQLRP